MAKAVDLGKRTIENAEAGKAVRSETLRTLAEALGVTLEDLYISPPARANADIDNQATDASTAPRAWSIRPHQLPASLPDFVGREQETQQLTKLLLSEGRPRAFVICGMGGVGKTSLAIRAAREVKDRFQDGQLFFDLRGASEDPATRVEVMKKLIRDFHPEATTLPDGEAELLGLLRSTISGKRILLILDNAESETQVRDIVTSSQNAGVVLTSRRAMAFDGVESFRLDVLPEDQATNLLRGIIGKRGTSEELREIVGLCGHLPLALRVAGDFLRLKTDWTVQRYIEALHEEQLRWLKVGSDPRKDVEGVLKLSAAQLARDNVELATRWHLLSIFPAEFDAPAAAACWDLAGYARQAHADLSTLVERSMVNYDTGSRRYRLHDLMKPIAAELFG